MAQAEVTLPAFAEGSRLLSVKQTMALLGIRSRTSLWRYVKRGLKPVKIGNTPQAPIRFRYDQVMYWLEGQQA